MTYTALTFPSDGVTCAGRFYPGAAQSPFDDDGRRPVVIMAHGFGGTVDSGLDPFAQAFADAGLAVLAFDYRGFGASQGSPRQRIRLADQAQDYSSAIAAAAAQPGVDPERIVLWGVSMSGGTVVQVAAGRTDVAAVIALAPLVNGLAAGVHAYPQSGVRAMARSAAAGMRSAVAGRLGRAGTLMPIVGRPGENAALTAPGFYEAYTAIAGPTWRNEVDATVGLEIGGLNVNKAAAAVTAPVLVQIADLDQGAPPQAAAKTAFKARAQVRHYPCDHFDVFAPNDWFAPAVAHQLAFLTRQLAPAAAHR